jgi:hypothetical protein
MGCRIFRKYGTLCVAPSLDRRYSQVSSVPPAKGVLTMWLNTLPARTYPEFEIWWLRLSGMQGGGDRSSSL